VSTVPLQTENTDPEEQSLSHQKFRLLPGGEHIYFQIGDYKELVKGTIFPPEIQEEYDVCKYFDGKLKVYHLGSNVKKQYTGAALPAKPTGKTLHYVPHKRLNWIQPDIISLKMSQLDKRQSEKSIMGLTAFEAIARGGVVPQPYSAWAHTKPDHVNFLGRTEQELRVPGYVAANQVHTAFESAAKLLAKKYNEIEVTRKLGKPIAGDSGLISQLKLGFVLRDEQNKPHHYSHNQPYFTNKGARNGDEVAIFRYIEIQKDLLEAGKPTLASKEKTSQKRQRRFEAHLSSDNFVPVAGDYLHYLLKADEAHDADRAKALAHRETSDVNSISQSDTSATRLDERHRRRSRGDRED
jgi:hypothetical protein